ncbi:hypothetical protein MPTK1_6g12070 [Marchantia polymorpha subsp. ruderalis]|uniref:Uncharacterized protein n=2 Tax=Marchantia polymorpha TaxID=3197 RepID=A0AAF6BR44_MARPO|nr:hypothetical protein MARPO_0135s0029 [Marchantia polymorpha]BBN14478.1 hypothetical protein Mp_6g12070 [Marchantia polymorpha subsp. ruderalis]|eukprot:PTQ29746.1 hypothetical protein MARPO_0135s0029 [Marchantia polymorpha]
MELGLGVDFDGCRIVHVRRIVSERCPLEEYKGTTCASRNGLAMIFPSSGLLLPSFPPSLCVPLCSVLGSSAYFSSGIMGTVVLILTYFGLHFVTLVRTEASKN